MHVKRAALLLFHHNFGCPSSSQIFPASREAYFNWPLHAKPVDVMDQEVVHRLAAEAGGELYAIWKERHNWLTNGDGRYAPVAAHARDHWFDEWPKAKASMSAEHFATFTKVGFVDGPHVVNMIDNGKKLWRPLARCRVFLNPENVLDPIKYRLRGLTHTYDFNNTYTSVGYLALMGLRDTIRSVYDGELAVCLDHASFFSQFAISDEVKDHTCFEYKGQWYRWTRLAMGTRPACHCAQSTIDVLAHESRKTTVVRTYIDNLKFSAPHGERDKLRESVMTYIKRSTECKSKLNDIPYEKDGSLPSDKDLYEWIDSQIMEETEFLGVRMNHGKKTVCLATKTLRKVTKIQEQCLSMAFTSRQFSACMSLLLYTHQILNFHIAGFNHALQTWRAIHARRQEDNLWDASIDITDACRIQMLQWAEIAAANTPRFVPKEAEPPRAFLITDASSTGWSGIIVIPSSGEIRYAAGVWPERMQHSSMAEPIAVYMALTALVPSEYTGVVQLCSDNSGTVFAFRKGFATSSTLSTVLTAVHAYAPDVEFTAAHIAGTNNPADEESRGNEMDTRKLMAFIAGTLGISDVVWDAPKCMNGIAPCPVPRVTPT